MAFTPTPTASRPLPRPVIAPRRFDVLQMPPTHVPTLPALPRPSTVPPTPSPPIADSAAFAAPLEFPSMPPTRRLFDELSSNEASESETPQVAQDDDDSQYESSFIDDDDVDDIAPDDDNWSVASSSPSSSSSSSSLSIASSAEEVSPIANFSPRRTRSTRTATTRVHSPNPFVLDADDESPTRCAPVFTDTTPSAALSATPSPTIRRQIATDSCIKRDEEEMEAAIAHQISQLQHTPLHRSLSPRLPVVHTPAPSPHFKRENATDSCIKREQDAIADAIEQTLFIDSNHDDAPSAVKREQGDVTSVKRGNDALQVKHGQKVLGAPVKDEDREEAVRVKREQVEIENAIENALFIDLCSDDDDRDKVRHIDAEASRVESEKLTVPNDDQACIEISSDDDNATGRRWRHKNTDLSRVKYEQEQSDLASDKEKVVARRRRVKREKAVVDLTSGDLHDASKVKAELQVRRLKNDDGDVDEKGVRRRPSKSKTSGRQRTTTTKSPQQSVDALATALSKTAISTGGAPDWLGDVDLRRASGREEAGRRLLEELDARVLNGALGKHVCVKWNGRLRTTAGLCALGMETNGERMARIELSVKVVDDVLRLYNTLAHEMCHAAAWIVDETKKPPHGKTFKKWAALFTRFDSTIQVTTCHSYDIRYKFAYTCVVCGHTWGRHSKSIDTAKTKCSCGGKLTLTKAGSAGAKK